MKISNGKVSGVRWRTAKHFGGRMTPKGIVLHETASPLTKFGIVNYFQRGERTVSAHFVIERDGTVTQMVPTDRVAYHAGRSRWGNIVGCNSCFVGIELVGPGKMDARGVPWFKRAIQEPIEHKRTDEHGDGYWLQFTREQIDAAVQICRACCDEYEACNEIVTHWQISPGRKIDPHPLLDLEAFKSRVFEGDGPDDESTKPPEKEPLLTEDTKSTIKTVGTVGTVAGGGATVATQAQAPSPKERIGTAREGVALGKDIKGLVPPVDSLTWPALILGAAILGAVLMITRR